MVRNFKHNNKSYVARVAKIEGRIVARVFDEKGAIVHEMSIECDVAVDMRSELGDGFGSNEYCLDEVIKDFKRLVNENLIK